METEFENIQCGIQEFAFITGLHPSYASDIFKQICYSLGKEYKPKMKLTLKELGGSDKENVRAMVEKARQINENYFKLYESKMKLLNNKQCIETGKWGSSPNAPVKVFLKPEDIEAIETNWRMKREQFYSQTTMFDVQPKLYVPRKQDRKKEKKVNNPNQPV